MSLPRVLHVISSLDSQSGGPSTALAGMAAAQVHAGHEVEVLATFRPGEDIRIARELERNGVRLTHVGPGKGSLVRHPDLEPRIRQAVSRAEIVHIHALWEEAQVQGMRAAAEKGIPYIVRPCGMLDPWSLKQSAWKKALYMRLRLRRHLNAAAAIHYTTRREADLAAPLGLLPRPVIQPNGLDWSEWESLPEPRLFRREFPELGDAQYLLFLGRLHYKKGLDLLLPVLARLGEGVQLAVAGPEDASYRRKLERLCGELGVRGRVHFTGMLDGRIKQAALAGAALLVLPSRQENFGNVVIESLAAGTPAVVSENVNLCDFLRDQNVGGVASLDANSLAACVSEWLDRKKADSSVSDRCRRAAREHFDWKRIAANWTDVYTQLIGEESSQKVLT